MATSRQDAGTETKGTTGTTDAPDHVEAGVGAGIGMNAMLPPLPGVGSIDPKRLLWWGGLAAAGALGVIEWPVAAAVGVGSYVAEQFARNERRQEPGAR